MVNADLGPLRLAHPENWQITMPRNARVTSSPLLRLPESPETGVGYGVLISSAAPPKGQRMSIDDLTDALVAEYAADSNHVKPAGNMQAITIDGIQGRSVALQSFSPFATSNGQQQVENDWLVTVPQRDGSIIYFIFVAPQPEFDRFRPAFESMLRSVQF